MISVNQIQHTNWLRLDKYKQNPFGNKWIDAHQSILIRFPSLRAEEGWDEGNKFLLPIGFSCSSVLKVEETAAAPYWVPGAPGEDEPPALKAHINGYSINPRKKTSDPSPLKKGVEEKHMLWGYITLTGHMHFYIHSK